MAEKTSNMATRERQGLTRHEPWGTNPFRMLEQMADEIDSIFDNFGLGRNWLAPRWSRGGMRTRGGAGMWMPEIEVYRQNNELVIRADLPGMKKDDVSIDVTDNDITVSGERRQEQDTEHGGVYRTERSYGTFSRTIGLPEGAMTDQAKATFKDGVLEIRMPTPPEQVTRGRRLEIKESADAKK